MGLRAGTRTATLIVEGDSVDFVTGLRQTSPRSYPFSSIDGIVVRSAGSGGSNTLNPPAVEILTGSVVGGLCNHRALWLENNLNDAAFGDDWPKYRYHVRGILGPAHFSGIADPTIARAGIGIGHPWDDLASPSPITRPPWPNPSSTTWCRLVYIFKTATWELQSTPGNGTEPTAIVSFAHPLAAGRPNMAELVYDPWVPAVYAILAGVERARITTLAKLPRFDSAGVVLTNYLPMANVFAETGTVDSTSVTLFASNFLCWHDNFDDPGATLW